METEKSKKKKHEGKKIEAEGERYSTRLGNILLKKEGERERGGLGKVIRGRKKGGLIEEGMRETSSATERAGKVDLDVSFSEKKPDGLRKQTEHRGVKKIQEVKRLTLSEGTIIQKEGGGGKTRSTKRWGGEGSARDSPPRLSWLARGGGSFRAPGKNFIWKGDQRRILGLKDYHLT